MASEPNESRQESQPYDTTLKRYNEVISTLPKSEGWWSDNLLQYKGFWLSSKPVIFKGLMLIEDQHLVCKPDDIILATYPKCGTTWLRALIFATINRNSYDFSTHPLLTSNPLEFVPFLERYAYQNPSILEKLPSPRLLSTHLPYSFFPKSTTSNSRFVHVCRDPKDVIVSKWHFAQKLRPKELPPLSFQEAFELFCNGVSTYGPYWDHVLSYWKSSLEAPNKVLFLKYEDMKRDPSVHVKKLAEFLGKPFSVDEQKEGVVDEIIRLCSFEKMSNLEVNKGSVSSNSYFRNSFFFRKAEVGDWKNYLTPEMAARVDQITKDKFHASGLSFA